LANVEELVFKGSKLKENTTYMKIRVNGHHNMARACNANIWDASVVFG